MKWEMVKLGEVCQMTSGNTPNRSNSNYFKGKIPWAKISDIDNAEDGIIKFTEEYITDEALSSINNRIFPKGILLLAMYGSVGKTAFTGMEMSTNQAILGIKIIQENILNYSYLKYWFDSVKRNLLNRAVGGTLQNISLGIVKDLKIPLPPLATQQRIADILDKADALRRKDQALLQKYDELAQAVFVEMFGDLSSKNYTHAQLEEVANIVNGVTKNEKLQTPDMREVPYLRVANVQDNFLDLKEIKTIRATASDIDKYQLIQGDILLTEGGDADKLGRGTIWNEEIPHCIFQNHLFRVRVTSQKIIPHFLNKLIGSPYGKKYFLKAAKQTTGIATINTSQLKAFPVVIPSLEEQLNYKRVESDIKKNMAFQEATLSHSTTLFQSLLQKAFTGELVP